MSQNSKIEWTDATWNPVRGCLKISPGCKHCYAETFAERFRDVRGHPYQHGFDPRLAPGKLIDPLLWPSPRTVFVNSMSDLFQDAVPDDYILGVAEIMCKASWHTYQVLTKRAARLQSLLGGKLRAAAAAQHIWWGVSVEDKVYGVPRIEQLRHTPASVRFLSVEPLLEDLGPINLSGIDWVIVGGESGPGARPIQEEWVARILRECRASTARFFFKQWGGVQKGKYGRILNGRTYDEMPTRVTSPVPSRRERQELIRSLTHLTDGWTSEPIVQLSHRRVVA
jgi:protein gp37